VPVSNAIVGIDLAERKQLVVVADRDSKVLARRTFRCKAWDLGAALDWAAERAARAGFGGVTVAADWSSLARAGSAGVGPGNVVRVRAAVAVVVGAKDRGPTSDKTDERTRC
jgi:hypothetical protein